MKSRVSILVFCGICFSILYLLNSKSAIAADPCDLFDYSPRPLLASSSEANFTLGRTESGKNYSIEIDCSGLTPNVMVKNILATENSINITIKRSQHSCVFKEGNHNISLIEQPNSSTSPACTNIYNVISGCQLKINDDSPDTNTDIIISGTNVSSQANLLCISGPLNPYYSISVKSDNTFSQAFKLASKGDYVAKVGSGARCDQIISTFGCPELRFSVRMPGAPRGPGGGGTGIGAGGGIKPTECDYDGDGNLDGIETALGCIPTKDPTKFIGWILRIAIGLGGGIAFLLIVFGAFQVITSSGNPESVKKGTEMITAAISGLLFIIFSLFLLKLIGVNILKIPGFGTP